jgi:hypothetical protein
MAGQAAAVERSNDKPLLVGNEDGHSPRKRVAVGCSKRSELDCRSAQA